MPRGQPLRTRPGSAVRAKKPRRQLGQEVGLRAPPPGWARPRRAREFRWPGALACAPATVRSCLPGADGPAAGYGLLPGPLQGGLAVTHLMFGAFQRKVLFNEYTTYEQTEVRAVRIGVVCGREGGAHRPGRPRLQVFFQSKSNSACPPAPLACLSFTLSSPWNPLSS